MATPLTRSEQEVVMNIADDETEWVVTSTSPKMTRLFREICERVGGRCVEKPDYVRFFLPRSEIVISSKRRLNFSAAQRAKRQEQMAAINQTRGTVHQEDSVDKFGVVGYFSTPFLGTQRAVNGVKERDA